MQNALRIVVLVRKGAALDAGVAGVELILLETDHVCGTAVLDGDADRAEGATESTEADAFVRQGVLLGRGPPGMLRQLA
jgi:hypothetical protein